MNPFVIVVFVASLAGNPVGLFSYNKASYMTEKICEEARPAIVNELASHFVEDKAPVQIVDSKCVSQASIDSIKKGPSI
jgi:hypothetical protein